MSLGRVLAAALLACSASSAFATEPPVAVTTCGQAVPRLTTGYLTADLDCSGADVLASVFLSRKATLELRGFRITGGQIGVMCGEQRLDKFGEVHTYSVRRCTIVGGGGTISAPGANGIAGDEVIASDVTIENAGQDGINVNRKAQLDDIVVTGSAGFGMRILGPATVSNLNVLGNGKTGLLTTRSLRITDSTVLGNGVGACPDPRACVDVFTPKRPKAENVVCDTSGGNGPVGNWNICGSD